MTVQAVVQGVVDAALLLLGVVACIDWLRRRSRAYGFLALAVGCLALLVAFSLLSQAADGRYSLLTDLALLSFLASGYALVLFRDTVIAMSRTAHIVVASVVAVMAVVSLAARFPATKSGEPPHYSAFQSVVILVLIAVWCTCVAEPALRMWFTARRLPAVQRKRMRAMSYGYLAIVLIFVLAVAGGTLSAGSAKEPVWLQVVVDVVTLAIVPLLWSGFFPPPLLRAWWRRSEEAEFRDAVLELILFSRDRQMLAARGLEWATRLIGADGGLITDSDGTILAHQGMDEAEATEIRDLVGTTRSDIVTEHGERGARRVRRGATTLVAVPLPYAAGTGSVVLRAGVLTPVFGADEIQRQRAYAGSIAVAMDRVRLTEELNASEARFRRTFEDAPVGIAIVGVDGSLDRVNRALCDMTGYAQDELLRLRFLEMLHVEDRDEAQALLDRILAGELRTAQIEKRICHADGHTVWGLIAASIVRDRDATPLHLVVQVEDITARRRAEEAEARARHEADRASQAKSEFLSRMSHELRTPLNAVLGFAELLEMGELDATERQYVTTILRAGNHLLDLINDVLDISRIEEGRMSLSVEPIALRQLLTETVDLVRPLGAGRDIALPADFPDVADAAVLADHQRVKQILLNLLSNAIKYNRPGGSVRVDVDTTDGRTRIEVSDSGAGISKENLPKLFSPFERLDAARTGVEGTGLGLALSQRLAEAMGGRLGVRSEVGEGSTFWLELSTATPIDEHAGARAGVVGGRRQAGRSSRRLEVLYIEDTLSNLRLMEGIVAARPDIHLVPAMQGRLGLELARQHLPDLVLLDLHLPDIAGDELLLSLRSDPATRDVPVVVISADATQRQIERLMSLGARDYLTKPLNVRRVLEVLDGALAAQPAQAGGAAQSP